MPGRLSCPAAALPLAVPCPADGRPRASYRGDRALGPHRDHASPPAAYCPAAPLTLLPPLRAAGGSRAVLRRLPISAYSLAARPVCREGVCPVLPDDAAPSSRGSKLASAVSNGQLTSPQARLFGFFSSVTPCFPLPPPRCDEGDGSCRLTLSRRRRGRAPPTLPWGQAGSDGKGRGAVAHASPRSPLASPPAARNPAGPCRHVPAGPAVNPCRGCVGVALLGLKGHCRG